MAETRDRMAAGGTICITAVEGAIGVDTKNSVIATNTVATSAEWVKGSPATERIAPTEPTMPVMNGASRKPAMVSGP
jgi:hypothetical protein